jgi:hypothetical protein
MFCFLGLAKTNPLKPSLSIVSNPFPSKSTFPSRLHGQLLITAGNNKAAFLRYRLAKRVDKLTSYVKEIFSKADAYII